MVKGEDPAFKNPAEPIGPFYDEETARKFAAERGFIAKKVLPAGERQYRRVVP